MQAVPCKALQGQVLAPAPWFTFDAPCQQSLLVLRQGTQLLSKQNVPYTPGCMLHEADAA